MLHADGVTNTIPQGARQLNKLSGHLLRAIPLAPCGEAKAPQQRGAHTRDTPAQSPSWNSSCGTHVQGRTQKDDKKEGNMHTLIRELHRHGSICPQSHKENVFSLKPEQQHLWSKVHKFLHFYSTRYQLIRKTLNQLSSLINCTHDHSLMYFPEGVPL